MKNITELKAESTLNKIFRYDEGIMTRKEWLKIKLSQGYCAEIKERRNYVAEEKLEKWLHDHRDMICGNINWPPTKAWYSEEARLKSGIFKTEFQLCNKKDNTLYDITKAEYNYFNNTLLAMEIKTQQMDVPNRIEAGIATKEEINEYMKDDINFFTKYVKI